MKEPLSEQIAYFKEHQKELAEKHHREFVLIHNQSEVGFYESGGRAYEVAIERRLESGTFLIRQCLRPDEESVAIFHSRVA
jgi:hypothetical protein